jgi:hypothetical protein
VDMDKDKDKEDSNSKADIDLRHILIIAEAVLRDIYKLYSNRSPDRKII